MVNRQLEKLLSPIRRRISLMVARGVVTLVNDSLKRQNLQLSVLADESADSVERFQNYGHTSVPPVGSEAVMVAASGSRSGLVAVAVEHKDSRPKNLEDGDSMLYHLEGHFLKLTKDGRLVIKATEVILEATTKFTIISPDTLIQGPLHVTDEITTDADISAQGVSYLGHTHLDAEKRDTSAPQR
ncbi:phage baseplate assembly protein V [Photobacterium damselae]|uniref:phage baseplate assembly protein V n=1 Tax=Photobacterium damselae TaxID=38293 RepID=UPI000D664D34|nr:phage baseplate assembly protein V [Photobacterium damselae]AWK84467.1 phage baseplate protein [Photobacterium damselae]